MKNRKKNKKIILKTIAFTIIIEFVFAIIFWYIIYYNYDKLTVSESWISKNTLELKEIKFSENLEIKKNIKDDSILYDWKFWKIEHFYKKDKKENESIEENKYLYNIKQSNIDKIFVINFLSENKLLDKYLYKFLFTNKIDSLKEFENIINLSILLNYKTKEEWSKILIDFQDSYQKQITKIENYISKDDFKKLSVVFKIMENKTKFDSLPNNILGNTWLISTPNFKYVLWKLYEKKYLDIIKNISNITWIDYKLILSSIAVEQLRYLTTNRGYAKKLIKNNNYLTSFTKFSYWLGWIKTHTFNNINHWISKYNSNLYLNYYYPQEKKTIKDKEELNKLYSNEKKIEENKEKKDEEKIKEILESRYGWTLYTAWLLYSIKKKWKLAWFDISDRPWVILTLYNMGNNKVPHWKPALGWSLIAVTEDEKLYFWEIGFIFFHYMKYYLDSN